MKRLPAHERPGTPVQGHLTCGQAVQEQGNPWWDGVPVPRQLITSARTAALSRRRVDSLRKETEEHFARGRRLYRRVPNTSLPEQLTALPVSLRRHTTQPSGSGKPTRKG
jgi:hypothetical protein